MADTYAWALMPNHFHFLVRIKQKEEIPTVVVNPEGAESPVRVGTPAQQFSKFFNSYAQAFNKRYHRHAGLFERPFKRKRIDNPVWLKRTILYIHNNAAHHGFCEHPLEYPRTSYLSCISVKPTKLQREKVLGWFTISDNANKIAASIRAKLSEEEANKAYPVVEEDLEGISTYVTLAAGGYIRTKSETYDALERAKQKLVEMMTTFHYEHQLAED